ncbi:DUF1656 domain-containing protein [Govanella unica]|uniref:DUF1656 domain-containing protein n=1 Tax=Govanella unica TaxID=2975056 RepID=A0A9X3Z7U1_9PROT|nr:DUF1656 domain-containing protein [Govania unica]MDA5194388.1 DUF1656 domain-containing protein [Govania unica]
MIKEIDFFGLYLTPMLAWMILTFGIWLLVCRILEYVDAYRFVWHRSLFNVALYVILLGGVTYVLPRILY